MSESNIITKTKEPNTVDSISKGLFSLGIRQGDILLVHSSLSSLGWVCGGAQAVIMALMSVVGAEGTLVMTAHSGDWSDPAQWQYPPVPTEWIQEIYEHMPAYNPQITPTRGMGRIAELFRTYPNTLRSGHPQVSFSANGSVAAHIVEDHPLTPQFGMESPLGKLYHMNAKVLLLGVGYDSCTSFHLAESLMDDMQRKRMGTSMLEDNRRVWKWFEDFAYDSDDFELIGRDFEANHKVKKGKVGNADCTLFDMKTGVDFAKEWLENHRI